MATQAPKRVGRRRKIRALERVALDAIRTFLRRGSKKREERNQAPQVSNATVGLIRRLRVGETHTQPYPSVCSISLDTYLVVAYLLKEILDCVGLAVLSLSIAAESSMLGGVCLLPLEPHGALGAAIGRIEGRLVLQERW